MLHLTSLRKAFKIVIFLLIGISLTGCYSLKTTSLNNMPPRRNVIILHAGDSFWTVSDYAFSDNNLTGLIYQDSLKIRKLKVTHLYAAPASSVKIEGTRLTVPKGNISKADYFKVDWWTTLGGAAVIAVVVFTFLPALFY
jgi:hypothetical protein